MQKVRKTRLERQHQPTGTSLAADAAGDDTSRSVVSSSDSLPGVSLGEARQDTGICSDSGSPSTVRPADSVPHREVPRNVHGGPLDGNSLGGVVSGPTHTVSVLPNLEHQSVNSRHSTPRTFLTANLGSLGYLGYLGYLQPQALLKNRPGVGTVLQLPVCRPSRSRRKTFSPSPTGVVRQI